MSAVFEPYLQTALEQAPILVVTLGAFVYVVRTFLTHIEEATERQAKRDAARDQVDLARAEGLARLGDECHTVQREATQVMEAVRGTLEANTSVLQENSEVLKQNNHCLCEVACTHRALQEKLSGA